MYPLIYKCHYTYSLSKILINPLLFDSFNARKLMKIMFSQARALHHLFSAQNGTQLVEHTSRLISLRVILKTGETEALKYPEKYQCPETLINNAPECLIMRGGIELFSKKLLGVTI
jgi:hypothetical protein